MSRIGKQRIHIPEGVKVTSPYDSPKVVVEGPKGTVSKLFPPIIQWTYWLDCETRKGGISLQIVDVIDKKRMQTLSQAFYGLSRTLFSNMITGVSVGFDKRLRLDGVGYKVKLEGKDLILNVGYSHPVKMVVPQELNVNVESSTSLVISGFQKDVVGEFASKIRFLRPPEPYKGRGIFYENETIRRKVGKRAK